MLPTYTYRCPHCGAKTETNHKAGTRAELDCPNCGTRMVWQFPTPRLHTNTSLHLSDGLATDKMRRRAYAQARAAGISPAGKTFMPSLADRRGYADPEAWVSQDDFRSSVKRVCNKRGHGCDGTVTVKPPELDEPALPPYRPDPKMVARDVDRINKEEHDGQLSPDKQADLHEKLTEQYAGAM